MNKDWSNITNLKCYPTENSNRFFCEIHHHTKEGSTLDGFESNRLYFDDTIEMGILVNIEHYKNEPFYKGDPIEPILYIRFKDKNGYCELYEIESDESIEVHCGKKPTFGELYEKRN